jgi:hypothetical protein
MCREIQIAEIWFYYFVLHHCKNRRFLKPFTAHTSDLLELTSLSNKFDGHNQGKPENFPHFCSRTKPTIFRAHTSDLHRFCSNRLVRRTKPSKNNAVCLGGALMVYMHNLIFLTLNDCCHFAKLNFLKLMSSSSYLRHLHLLSLFHNKLTPGM